MAKARQFASGSLAASSSAPPAPGSGRSERTTERLEPGISQPYLALRGPTYRENSHANHTWPQHSDQTACFKTRKCRPWVRFPSPAPLFDVWRVPALPWDATWLSAQFPQSRRDYNRSFDRMRRSVSAPRSRSSHPSVTDPEHPDTNGSYRAA
jgi:hypothetical protein